MIAVRIWLCFALLVIYLDISWAFQSDACIQKNKDWERKEEVENEVDGNKKAKDDIPSSGKVINSNSVKIEFGAEDVNYIIRWIIFGGSGRDDGWDKLSAYKLLQSSGSSSKTTADFTFQGKGSKTAPAAINGFNNFMQFFKVFAEQPKNNNVKNDEFSNIYENKSEIRTETLKNPTISSQVSIKSSSAILNESTPLRYSSNLDEFSQILSSYIPNFKERRSRETSLSDYYSSDELYDISPETSASYHISSMEDTSQKSSPHDISFLNPRFNEFSSGVFSADNNYLKTSPSDDILSNKLRSYDTSSLKSSSDDISSEIFNTDDNYSEQLPSVDFSSSKPLSNDTTALKSTSINYFSRNVPSNNFTSDSASDNSFEQMTPFKDSQPRAISSISMFDDSYFDKLKSDVISYEKSVSIDDSTKISTNHLISSNGSPFDPMTTDNPRSNFIASELESNSDRPFGSIIKKRSLPDLTVAPPRPPPSSLPGVPHEKDSPKAKNSSGGLARFSATSLFVGQVFVQVLQRMLDPGFSPPSPFHSHPFPRHPRHSPLRFFSFFLMIYLSKKFFERKRCDKREKRKSE